MRKPAVIHKCYRCQASCTGSQGLLSHIRALHPAEIAKIRAEQDKNGNKFLDAVSTVFLNGQTENLKEHARVFTPAVRAGAENSVDELVAIAYQKLDKEIEEDREAIARLEERKVALAKKVERLTMLAAFVTPEAVKAEHAEV